MNKNRSKEMDATRRSLKNASNAFKAMASFSSGLNSRVFCLFNKRMNDRGIRSLFVRLIHNYVVECAKNENIALRRFRKEVFDEQLPFVAETIITVQYYENQILDGKGGIRNAQNDWDKAGIDRNLLASHIIKDDLYNFIEDQIFPDSLVDARAVTKSVRRIFKCVDLGQDFQDQYGTLESWELGMYGYQHISAEVDTHINYEIIQEFWKSFKGIPEILEHEWFVRNYLKRIYLTSGSLFLELARLVMDLTGYFGVERDNILKFSITHGILGQLVNDNNDIMLPEHNLTTISKVPEDAFADLKNNNITLPIIMFLAGFKGNIIQIRRLQSMLNKKDNWWVLSAKLLIKNVVPPRFRPTIEKFTNTKKYLQVFETLLPPVKQSIDMVDQLRGFLISQNLLKSTQFGQILYDMNSMASIEHNKYSTLIMKQPSLLISAKNTETKLVSPFQSVLKLYKELKRILQNRFTKIKPSFKLDF